MSSSVLLTPEKDETPNRNVSNQLLYEGKDEHSPTWIFW